MDAWGLQLAGKGRLELFFARFQHCEIRIGFSMDASFFPKDFTTGVFTRNESLREIFQQKNGRRSWKKWAPTIYKYRVTYNPFKWRYCTDYS